MTIRILAGRFKNYCISVLPGDTIKPTSVMLRRRFFDTYQNLTEKIFVDLTAGTGIMGMEALSRGARKAILIEESRSAYLQLLKNCTLLKEKFILHEDELEVENLDFKRWLMQVDVASNRFMLFFDPPYKKHQDYWHLIEWYKKSKFAGELFIQSDQKLGVKMEDIVASGVEVIKELIQGSNFIISLGKTLRS